MDRATVEQHLSDAGPDGRLCIRFRDRWVPKLDENAEAVYGENADGTPGATPLHEEHAVGISRIISAWVTQIIDTHVAIGMGPGHPIEFLIAFDDIEAIRPDPADHDAAVIRAGAPAQPESGPAPAEVAQPEVWVAPEVPA